MLASNTNSSVFIRPMTHQDLEIVINLHRKSFDGYMNVFLGKQFLKKYMSWFVSNSSASAYVAEESNIVVGYFIGAPVGYPIELNKYLLKVGIWSIISHPKIFLHPNFIQTIRSRLKIFLKKNKNISLKDSESFFSLVGIACDPNIRNIGVGKKLMDEFKCFVFKNGYSMARLSVYEENYIARSFYEKNGWKFLSKNKNIINYYLKIIL
jgi:ribosomal protein S18 acetylase RimI-like enzyme